MSACCDQIAQSFPEAGVVCQTIEQRYCFACTEMDVDMPMVDYRSGTPRPRVEPPDGRATARDILRWATSLAELEWREAFRQQKPFTINRSLFEALPPELRPPFAIISPDVFERRA